MKIKHIPIYFKENPDHIVVMIEPSICLNVLFFRYVTKCDQSDSCAYLMMNSSFKKIFYAFAMWNMAHRFIFD